MLYMGRATMVFCYSFPQASLSFPDVCGTAVQTVYPVYNPCAFLLGNLVLGMYQPVPDCVVRTEVYRYPSPADGSADGISHMADIG